MFNCMVNRKSKSQTMNSFEIGWNHAKPTEEQLLRVTRRITKKIPISTLGHCPGIGVRIRTVAMSRKLCIFNDFPIVCIYICVVWWFGFRLCITTAHRRHVTFAHVTYIYMYIDTHHNMQIICFAQTIAWAARGVGAGACMSACSARISHGIVHTKIKHDRRINMLQTEISHPSNVCPYTR